MPEPFVQRRAHETAYVAAAAVFLASYLTWRPVSDIMFTLSDALFILTAWQLAARNELPLQSFGGLTHWWLASLGLVLGGLLVGSVADADPVRWLIIALQYTFAWLVLPVLLVGHGRDRAITLAKALVYGMAAMEAFGIIIYVKYLGNFWDARALLGIDFLTGARRLGAFTADANWNGGAVSFALPFVYYLVLEREMSRLSGAVVAAILLGGLALSASFTAFSSACVAAAVFAVVSGLRPGLKTSIAGLVAIGIVSQLQLVLPATFQARVVNAIESGDISEAGTFEGRAALIAEAWGMTDQHLLIGAGADQYRVISRMHAPVHNMYLLLWIEGGLVAMVGWISMIGVLVANAIGVTRVNRRAGALALSVTTVLIIFSVASPHMYARLWAVPVLLAVAVAREARTARRPARTPSPTNGLAWAPGAR